VKSTNGDTSSRRDFDMRLVGYLADEFQKEQGIDLRRDKLALQRLKGSRRKGQNRVVVDHADRNQSAVHHGRRGPVPSI